MSVVVKSLINTSQTLDSVALGPFATQTRAGSTAALVAAAAAHTIQMDEVDSDVPGVTMYSVVPVTTDVVTPPVGTEVALISPAGTIAAMTLNMPASPYDGQPFEVAFDQIITALTMAAPASATLKGALTAATAKGFAKWRYSKAATTWYRVG